MKFLKIISSILIGVSFFTGCASAPKAKTLPTQSPSTEIKQETKQTTKKYTSEIGEIEIPTEPKKIVSDYYIGELLKLDANLVGADLTFKSSAWAERVSNVKNIGDSLESILALNPDLIITFKEDKVKKYSEIAPTIYIPYGKYNPEQLLLELGKITGKEAIAEEWVKNFNGSIEHLKSHFTDPTQTISIMDIMGKDLYMYGANYARAGFILYDKLGLKGTADAEKDYIRKKDSYLLLPVESLPKYIGEILLFMNETGSPEGNSEITKKYTTSVFWETLPAVKNKKVFYLKSADFMYQDPFSLDAQIAILEKLLETK